MAISHCVCTLHSHLRLCICQIFASMAGLLGSCFDCRTPSPPCHVPVEYSADVFGSQWEGTSVGCATYCFPSLTVSLWVSFMTLSIPRLKAPPSDPSWCSAMFQTVLLAGCAGGILLLANRLPPSSWTLVDTHFPVPLCPCRIARWHTLFGF